MLAHDRRRQILQMLDQTGSLKLEAIAAAFGVTSMTVWRDLTALEGEGRLKRVHGGAVRLDRAMEPGFGQKEVRSTPEKRRIARWAAEKFVGPGSVVILEGGTTVAELLPHFTDEGITVLTNSLPILSRAHAGHRHLTLHASGGVVSPVSGNFVGQDAVGYFRRTRAGVFFMSATGLDPDSGRLTDPNPIEIEVKRAMAEAAKKVVLLLDASKLGAASVTEVLPLRQIDVLVTDSRATEGQRRALRRLGLELVVV